MSTYDTKVIKSPNVSIRAIWVPKSIVANIFFDAKTMGEFPIASFYKIKRVTNRRYLQSTEEKRMYRAKLTKVSSHCVIQESCSSLTLTRWRNTWSLKFRTHRLVVGFPLSKIFEFRSFQISHVAIMNVSMKKGNPIVSIKLRTRCFMSAMDGQIKPSFCQQVVAKGQLKNKCSRSSSKLVV